MADFTAVARQFTEYYYTNFKKNRSLLGALYSEESMLTFETNQVQGVNNIVEKLTSLPFEKVDHEIASLDAQPAGPDGSIIVHVTGKLMIDDEPNPKNYSQTFHLIPRTGSYYVRNDLFRLIY